MGISEVTWARSGLDNILRSRPHIVCIVCIVYMEFQCLLPGLVAQAGPGEKLPRRVFGESDLAGSHLRIVVL